MSCQSHHHIVLRLSCPADTLSRCFLEQAVLGAYNPCLSADLTGLLESRKASGRTSWLCRVRLRARGH